MNAVKVENAPIFAKVQQLCDHVMEQANQMDDFQKQTSIMTFLAVCARTYAHHKTVFDGIGLPVAGKELVKFQQQFLSQDVPMLEVPEQTQLFSRWLSIPAIFQLMWPHVNALSPLHRIFEGKLVYSLSFL